MPQAVSRRDGLKGASIPGLSAVRPPIRSTYRRMSGAIFTQTLPFYDDAVMKLYGEFARELGRALKNV